MANPTWFDYDFYMETKLAQMKKVDPSYKMDQLVKAFDEAGFSGEEGAYMHYDMYGDSEGVSPNAYMDVNVYMTAKLLQMQATDSSYTMEDLVEAFAKSGLTAGEHYELYGEGEGLNPSNEFDVVQYMVDKLAQLEITEPGVWTLELLQEAFDAANLSALDHFLLYGQDEGLTAKPVDDPIRPLNPGKTFTLTDKVDTFTGTDKDDVVTGTLADLNGDTLLDTNSDDFDVLNLTADATVETTNGTVAGFEILNVDWQGYGAAIIDASDFKGVKEINVESDKVGFLGDMTVNAAGAATVTAGDGMKGKLTVSDLNGGTVKTGVATSAVVSLENKADASGTVKVSETTKDVTFNGSAASGEKGTIIFTADGTLKTNETIETLTIDAGGKTITLDQTASAAVANTIKTAGTGDMTLKMDGADFVSATDTVTKGNTGALVVDIATLGAAIDVTKVTADVIRLSAAGTSVATVKSGQNFEVTADMGVGGFTVGGNGANDSLRVAFSANQGMSTTFTDVENAIIVAAAENLTFTSLVNAAGTIALLGDNNVTLTSVSTTTLNAAALNGDLTVAATTGAKDITISGSTGNNTVTFDAAAVKATFVGQDGNDTVTFATLGATSTSTVITGAGDDKVTANASALTTGVLAINTGAGADTVTLNGATTTGKIVLEFGEGADTLVLDATADLSKADLTITGLENIKIDAEATFAGKQLSGADYTITGLGAASSILTVVAGDAGTIDLSKLHVTDSASTGLKEVVVTGSAGVDIITGTSIADTFTGGAGKDILTGGAGADTFVVGNVTTDGIDHITDFVGGVDKIHTSATATKAAVGLVDKGALTGADLDTVLGTFATNGTNVTVEKTAYTFTYDGHSYLLVDNATAGYDAGTDSVIDITGMTGTLVAGDIFNAA